MIITLPYPPSVNHYWRRVGARTLISRKGRQYRTSVAAIVLSAMPRFTTLQGPLDVEIYAYPPDRRRRDIDNILKAPLDALEHARVYENDNQIVRLLVVKRERDADNPRVEIHVSDVREV